jgi:acid phosphatase
VDARNGSFALALALATSAALAGPSLATVSTRAADSPALDHVIVIIMENHSYDEVRNQPYTASLIQHYASFSASYAITHPSQPNYLALWAASTFGVTNDNCPPAGSPYSAANLGHACEAAGLTWRSYAENLPSVGSTVCSASGSLYTRKHDPWTQFSNLSHSNERPYSDLAVDIAAGTLPNLAFVIPNNCDNSHDGGACTAAFADTWLASHIPAMLGAVGRRGLVILTWDEDDGTSVNHILTVFAGAPVIPGVVSGQVISHYTVVRAICEMLGVAPIGAAASQPGITGVWAAWITGVPPAPPAGLSLGPPHPNPSSGPVEFELQMPDARTVEASVYDMAGRRVRRLLSDTTVRAVVIEWDGRDDRGRTVSGGVYLLKVRAGGDTLQRKIVRAL